MAARLADCRTAPQAPKGMQLARMFSKQRLPKPGSLVTIAAVAVECWNMGQHIAAAIAGKKLGSDVPFCIQGGTALAEGLGEKLTQLPGIPECLILLAKPAVSISTKEVYEGLKLEEIRERPDIKSMIQYIEGRNLEGITACMCNVLETVTIKKCSQIEELKEKLMEYGALGSIMSGSGPTVFGVFKDSASAYNAYDYIKDMVSEVFLVKTTNQNLDF